MTININRMNDMHSTAQESACLSPFSRLQINHHFKRWLSLVVVIGLSVISLAATAEYRARPSGTFSGRYPAEAACRPNGHFMEFNPRGNLVCLGNSGYQAWEVWADYYCPYGGQLQYRGIIGNEDFYYCIDEPICPGGQSRDAVTGQCPAGCPDGSLLCKQSGQTCPATNQPIAIGTGNKYLDEIDLSSGALTLRRSFNTSSTGYAIASLLTGGSPLLMPMGIGWTFNYQQRIRLPAASATTAWAIRPNGRLYTFLLSGSVWNADADVADRLTELKNGGGTRTGWRYWDASSQQAETYDANGLLQSITASSGVLTTLVYSDGSDGVASGQGGVTPDADGTSTALLPAGRLLRVQDNFGHILQFGYSFGGRVLTVSDSINGTGKTVRYTYDSSANLATVTYADGLSKTYLYGEPIRTGGASLPNALTGIQDENGERYISYTYDSTGKAIGEVLAGSVGSNQLTYTGANTSVTDALGASRTYSFTYLLGMNRLTSVSQPGGSGCSAASSALTYDANGNTASRTDFNNTKTCYAYDLSRNVETARVEGIAGAASCPDASSYSIPAPAVGASVTQRKISTQWHPLLKLETRRAEPKKIASFVYNGQPDVVGGGTASCAPSSAVVIGQPIAVLCKKVEQATSDVTGSSGFSASTVGAPRVWSYTYNAVGQVLSEDGPRTDVPDITTYQYYSDTAFSGASGHTQGDLWKVTNPLGEVTEFTAYDKAGHVLESRDANGVITQSTYSPRGWLTQQSVIGSDTKTTRYDYDNVGQLKKVTQPDGSFISYTYDAAHRLTDISDSLLNSIHYTLDAAGNRTGEAVSDPNGVLARSTARIFDQLGRLQNVVVAQ